MFHIFLSSFEIGLVTLETKTWNNQIKKLIHLVISNLQAFHMKKFQIDQYVEIVNIAINIFHKYVPIKEKYLRCNEG